MLPPSPPPLLQPVMQPSLTLRAAIGGVLTAGVFSLIVAHIGGRNGREQAYLRHHLEQEDRVREELYRDILTWALHVAAELMVVRDRAGLASILVDTVAQQDALLPRLLLFTTPDMERGVAMLDDDLRQL